MNIDNINKLLIQYCDVGVNTIIHPNDVMYTSGKDWYFTVGESGILCILSGLMNTKISGVNRILDLPCGHGRVARHLRAAFPSAEIFFCDIDREGVDFCVDTFHGKGIYSIPDLTKVNLPGGLDLIWVGSLFTHLNKEKTAAWLEYLVSKLSSNGIIVATFHGFFTVTNPPSSARVDVANLRQDFDKLGYGFEAYRNDDPVQLIEYGLSVSKPSAILDIATMIKGTRVVSYVERGWAENHDVLVLCNDDRLRPFCASA